MQWILNLSADSQVIATRQKNAYSTATESNKWTQSDSKSHFTVQMMAKTIKKDLSYILSIAGYQWK